MSEFESITRHIPELQKGDYVKSSGTLLNSGHAGTVEDPIPMPYVEYSDAVYALQRDIYDLCEAYPEYNIVNYQETLAENGIEWELASMSEADVSQLDAKGIIALFIGAFRAERFCDGAMLNFLENDSFLRWLKRLEELDASAAD